MISMNAKRVLILAPHTDDGELGCGGTISRWIEEGAEIHYAAFSTAEQSVPKGFPKDILKKEVKAATKALGIHPDFLFIYNYEVRKLNYVRQDILENMMELRRKFDYDLILLPSPKDIHQDHITVSQEGIRAFKTRSILGYELIWNNLSFNTTCFVPLQKKHIENKIKALSAYKSQGKRDYMSRTFIQSLACARGVQIGHKYAEAFEVIRWVF